MILYFEIPGAPMGKGRPRFAGAGRLPYTPAPTRDYERRVRQCYGLACGGKRFERDTALTVMIIAYMPIPQSVGKAKRRDMTAGKLLPTKKPDCDNIAKIVCDSLNKLAYYDDSQVVDLRIQKKYSPEARVSVWISDEV